MASRITQYVGAFVVVETDDNAYLGTLSEVDDERVTLHTGCVGRPPVLAVAEIELITLAADHAAVAA